jgi:hypothetical protein
MSLSKHVLARVSHRGYEENEERKMQSTILSHPFLSQFLSQPERRGLCFSLSYAIKENPLSLTY